MANSRASKNLIYSKGKSSGVMPDMMNLQAASKEFSSMPDKTKMSVAKGLLNGTVKFENNKSGGEYIYSGRKSKKK